MSNPGNQNPSANPLVNLQILSTAVQDVVKAINNLQQTLKDFDTFGGAIDTDLQDINTSLGVLDTSLNAFNTAVVAAIGDLDTDLQAINTTISTVFPLSTLTGSKTYDPASIADGDSLSTTVTVTGASLGDFAAVSFGLDTAGLGLTATVTAANTATVVFSNLTGAPVDLASSLLRVRTFS